VIRHPITTRGTFGNAAGKSMNDCRPSGLPSFRCRKSLHGSKKRTAWFGGWSKRGPQIQAIKPLNQLGRRNRSSPLQLSMFPMSLLAAASILTLITAISRRFEKVILFKQQIGNLRGGDTSLDPFWT
jgi:hypothetical protein